LLSRWCYINIQICNWHSDCIGGKIHISPLQACK
jgi:hypothetical protein